MERLVGAVAEPTAIADLDLPAQPPIPTVAKGIVPRVPLPEGATAHGDRAAARHNRHSLLRQAAGRGPRPELFETGAGTLYLGFHLDPLYRVHWNNETDPVEYWIDAPAGVSVEPAHGVGMDPEEPADADPREFLVQVEGQPEDTLGLRVQYFRL